MTTANTLEVRLNDLLVGYLTHYPDEKSVFVVDEGCIQHGTQRPMLSLSLARPGDENATLALLQDQRHKFSLVKAPPFFSNLLPEGSLRRAIAQRLKIHEDREFIFLSALGEDLPGAIILRPIDTPKRLKNNSSNPAAAVPLARDLQELKFSLGGMQMKFSMLRQGERFTLPSGKELGNYIIKPPSNDFAALPMNEAACMATARAVGINVPEVKLIPRSEIHGLPDMASFRTEEPFYAIRRFDRSEDGRIHIEDFAQVFNLRAHEKYSRVNYEMIGRTLLQYAGGFTDLKELGRRLIFNVLMGNGDAHVKNWSLIYDNPLRPRLAPAYDLVSTVAYTDRDTSIALNMGGSKHFRTITLTSFATLFSRIGITDQIHAEAMAEVRQTGQRILNTWRSVFENHQVPDRLIAQIEKHQTGLPLAKELAS